MKAVMSLRKLIISIPITLVLCVGLATPVLAMLHLF